MSSLPPELRDLIDSGPLAHLSTINADGSPQVSVIWIERDGDELLSGHMQKYAKLRNIERDPRVVLSFTAPRDPSAFLNPYAVLRAHATIEEGEHAWELLLGYDQQRLMSARAGAAVARAAREADASTRRAAA